MEYLKMKINDAILTYYQWLAEVELCHALMGGTVAMLPYLPQEEGETDVKYEIRRSRSKLLNIFKRTVNRLTGEVFSKILTSDENINENIKTMLNDIDLQGKNITRFAFDVFRNGLVDGSSHILIDYPRASAVTLAEEKRAELRPYWIALKNEQIIGFKTDGKNLIQVRIKETVQQDDGYGYKLINQIRLIEPGRFEIWQELKDGFVLTEQGDTSFDFIPLATWQAGEMIDRIYAKPPLIDLAELNLLHFQSSSDQRNILHTVRVPILFGKRILNQEGTDSTITIGSGIMAHSTDPDADLRYIEHSGAGIASGRQDLEDLKNEMGLFGLSLMLSQRTGDVTATEKALNSAENDSALKLWALTFNDFLNLAVDYTARIMKTESGGKLNINTDFRLSLRNTDASLIIQAFDSGVLPLDVVMEEFKRRGLIKENYDIVEIKAMLEDDARRKIA